MTEPIQYPLLAGRVLTRVIETGEGSDAILFVHGLGARADRWHLTLPSLARHGYHCYALDLPGHGFAQKSADIPAEVPGFAGFVCDALDALELERVFLIGTSLGGHISAWLACEEPRRVRGLVLVGATGLVPLSAEAGEAIRRNVQRTDRSAIAEKLSFVLADPALVTPRLVEEEYRINNSPGAVEGFVRLGDYIAGGINQHVVGARLAGQVGKLPMLLVWGEDDRAVPLALGREAQAFLKGVELIVVPRAGHAPYFERPQEFEPPVLRFLDRYR